MRPLVFGNPLLQQQYANDPRNAQAQGMIAQGSSTAPVQSWGEAVARALQAPIGGYFQSRTRHDYEDQDAKYRQGLAEVLKSPDPIAALQASQDPTLQGIGLQQGLDQTKADRAARIALANELMGKGLRLGADGSVSPVPKYGEALGGIKNAETMASIPGEVAKGQAMIPVDVQKQQALTPGEVNKAVAVAQGTMPIDVQKAANIAQATAPINAAKDIGVYNQTQGPQKAIENTEKLRDDYRADKNILNYQTVAPILESMKDAAGRNNRAADLNLVYGMAKIFDPGSVVREGEQVLVQNTAALPDQLVGMINRLNGGAALQPDTRKALLDEAYSRTSQLKGVYDNAQKFYSEAAASQGLDPKKVFYDLPAETPMPGSVPKIGAIQGGYRFKGGDPGDEDNWEAVNQ